MVVPSPHLMPVTGRCNFSHGKVWQDILKLSWRLKAPIASPIDKIAAPKASLPFDSVAWPPLGSKERRACSATSQHYLKIGPMEDLPQETLHGLWSTFPPVLKRGTGKIFSRPTKESFYQHFEMEEVHTIHQLVRRDDLITKLDLSDLYMHYLITKADHKYMRFMWEVGSSCASACCGT